MAGGIATFRDAFLPVIDQIRGIPGSMGLRLFTASVVLRQWTGARIGIGTKLDTQTPTKTTLGLYSVKVTQVSSKDIIASGSLFQEQDMKVGPITPPYAGSAADGDSIALFDPPTTLAPTEVFFNITGPGMPPGGAWFKKVSQDVSKSFRYTFIVRRTAEIP